MKDFSESAILTRLIQSLQNYSDWSQIINDGTTISLLGAFGERSSEIVRYLEYLYAEGKWGHAQNSSSLVSTGKLLSYNPQRKVSALSTTGLVVSHDPALALAGISGIFGTSDLEPTLTEYMPTLTQPGYFYIHAGDSFSTSNGITFFATEDVPYVKNVGDTSSQGTKYITVPVMQGILKSVDIPVLGNPFEEIILPSNNIESANNPVSKNFFSISGKVTGSSAVIDFNKRDSIYEASYDEYAFETELADDFSYLIIRFGNGVAGKIVPKNCLITINYVETLGSAGNVSTNYTLNKVVTQINPNLKLYCSNIPESGATAASVLGGQDEDSTEQIRGKAPKAYLTGGSIITDSGYREAITSPNIPYIQKATVFSGLKTDRVTGVVQNVINYSAIKVDGTAPSSSQYPQDVETVITGKNSPLDVLEYQAPGLLHTRLNFTGVSQANSTNLSSLVANIKTDLYSRLKIQNREFKQPLYLSEWNTYVQNTYALKDVNSIIEAIVDLPPSTFSSDTEYIDYYSTTFKFDRSFARLKNFNDGVIHCLKINIFFDCAECTYNGNSYSRTLFLMNDPAINPSYTVSFSTSNASPGTIVVGSKLVTLTAQNIVSPVTIVSKILEVAVVDTSLNYVYTSPSPGILTLTPKEDNLAEPSIYFPSSGGATGIFFTKNKSVNYKVTQYPYSPRITTYDYMLNSVVKTTVAPQEILPEDILTPYVPIYVTLDYPTLNPSDLNSSSLGSGSIKIPNFLFGSYAISPEKYINFKGGNYIELDSKIRIQVVGQVFDTKIEPYSPFDIIQIKENDSVDDIVVEVY